MKRQKNKRGFTLIEVLVVILIIGILTSVALPQYQKAIWKIRAAQIIPVVKALGDAERVYFATHNTYTSNIDDLDVSVPLPQTFDEEKNYWTIHLQEALWANHVYAEIDRYGSHHFYIRYDLLDGIMECMPQLKNGQGAKICQSLSHTTSYPCQGREVFQCYKL